MDAPGLVSGGLVGLRGALGLHPRVAAEAELMLIPTEDDADGAFTAVYGLRAHARVEPGPPLWRGRVRLFAVAGAGVHVVRGGGAQLAADTDLAYHWGGGARYALSPRLDARLDLRHLIVPDRTRDGATSDFEATIGVSYRFGGGGRRAVAAPAAPGPAVSVEIAGHTSAEGTPDANLELSLRRAQAVREHLVRRGIAPARLVAVGHGADVPIADNATEEGRRRNRRIELRVVRAQDLPR